MIKMLIVWRYKIFIMNMENSANDVSTVCSLPTRFIKLHLKRNRKRVKVYMMLIHSTVKICWFLAEWPTTEGVVEKKSSYLGYCAIFNTDLKLGNSSKSELMKHVKTKKHLSKFDAEASASKNTLNQFFQREFTDQTKLLRPGSAVFWWNMTSLCRRLNLC